MTAATDFVPGEFVKISLHRTVTSFFSPEATQQTFWVFARYISTVDRQIVVEYANGTQSLVDADHVHALDIVPSDEAAT